MHEVRQEQVWQLECISTAAQDQRADGDSGFASHGPSVDAAQNPSEPSELRPKPTLVVGSCPDVNSYLLSSNKQRQDSDVVISFVLVLQRQICIAVL